MKENVSRLARLSLLLALATVIHTAESLIPFNVLWFRFGFANIVGIATLYMFGFSDALIVTLGRIFLGSLASGTFGSPGFALSLSGGLCAIAAMGFAHNWGRNLFSEIGVSLIGALAHNTAQLTVAYFLLIRNDSIFLLTPALLFVAAGTGLLNGVAARFFLQTAEKRVATLPTFSLKAEKDSQN
ncbi:Gx transporter family protein [Desulfomonile tiedjei]|uniref:Putative membrane protein n=1 Tax=Desulfomonile tiedjei (strain ATCC 49306 / DSM 6799 / DCB-1) TaxID=706587 RepID=I4C2T1_DESTA|nr:Gx transporter family protein [Desulfomonile tiedjei]AFM23872.1 putative membrane protein [Desulfomonile tiedjei DSM 6799]